MLDGITLRTRLGLPIAVDDTHARRDQADDFCVEEPDGTSEAGRGAAQVRGLTEAVVLELPEQGGECS